MEHEIRTKWITDIKKYSSSSTAPDEQKKLTADKVEKNAPSPKPQPQNNIFISYSHRDKVWKNLLIKYFKVLENQGLIARWDDRHIQAGANWAQQIKQAAVQARMAIFLISDDFLASKFIIQQEVLYFLQRRENSSRVGWALPTIMDVL